MFAVVLLCFLKIIVCVCVCEFDFLSLQGYSKVDCTVYGKEWDFIPGEADAEGTEELPV